MQAQTIDSEHTVDPTAAENAVLHEALSSLRQEFHLVATDMRKVIDENARLSGEVKRLKKSRRVKHRASEVQRIRQECVEGLSRLQEVADSTRSTRSTRSRRRGDERETLAGGSPSDNWMKKMMMFMMMNELA